MKNKNKNNRCTVLGRHFSPRPGTIGLAQQHSGLADPRQPALRACARHSQRAVATCAAAQWHDRRGFAGGLGVAPPVGTPRGSDGGCAGQGGVVGFSPKTVGGGGGAEKMTRHDGVPSWRRSSGGQGGRR
jgi:hypothetical protein